MHNDQLYITINLVTEARDGAAARAGARAAVH